MKYSFIYFFINLVQISLCDLIVDLPNGKVKGIQYATPSGRIFYSWRGIPFAEPPVGPLRFLPPVKAKPWDGILDATKDKKPCISFFNFTAGPVDNDNNSEDCLYINVYVPTSVNSTSHVNPNIPVMFWIYGGAFVTGESLFSSLDPSPLLEENVIVVNFNYRVGTFGFLSTKDDVIFGNAGLKDQWLALMWTRENIAFFGGNPDDVTLFGQSAGSVSVGFHLMSSRSRNLFSAAILQSGTELLSSLQENARTFAFDLANKFNSNITKESTSAEVRDVLQTAPTDLIVNYSLTLGPFYFNFLKVSPVIEVPSNFSFLTTPMYEDLINGNCTKVPIIVGHCHQEATTFFNDISTVQSSAKALDENLDILVPVMPLKDARNKKEIAQKIRQLYVGEDGLFAKNLSAYMEWYSDQLFVRSIYKHVQIYSQYAPTYFYNFSYFGGSSKNNINIPGSSRVGHGDELAYLFNASSKPLSEYKDYLIRKRIVRLWTNFAKVADPTPVQDELLQNIKWEPVNPQEIKLLNIDDDLQIQPNAKIQKSSFWDNLWKTYAYHPYKTF